MQLGAAEQIFEVRASVERVTLVMVSDVTQVFARFVEPIDLALSSLMRALLHIPT